MSWFSKEVANVRGFSIRRLHGVALLAVIAVAVIVLVAAGVFVGYQLPYRTLPRPPLPPGQVAPKCNGDPKTMHAGDCLPHPTMSNQASITATNQGPDLSNNDPVYSASSWNGIAAHNSWAIFKVSQGTYYADGTAAPMAAAAKARGLVVGGYDFMDVCRSSPVSEADFFYSLLVRDGLTGAKTFPPVGDVEYPSGIGCNGHDWVGGWVSEIHRLSGRWPLIYTGAWWWQPNIGGYWPNPSLAWISGYGVRYPYMPSGRSQLDVWQYTDSGWNGATSSDLSIWRDGAAAFLAYTASGPPPPPPDPYRIFPKSPALVFRLRACGATVTHRFTEHDLMAAYVVAVKNRSRSRVALGCVLEPEAAAAAHRISYLAHHQWAPPNPNWNRVKAYPGGAREQFLLHAAQGKAIRL